MKKISSYKIKVEVNFQSSTWKNEVVRTRFPCPGLLDFLRNLFLKKRKILKYGRSMGSDSIAFNFLKELDSTDYSMQVLERLDS